MSLGRWSGMLEAEHFSMVASSGGRLELVAIAYRDSKAPEAIWHATQSPAPDDDHFGRWSDWRSLGKPDSQLAIGTRPAVGVNPDGRLEVAVAGTEVFHAWQGPGGDWSGWRPLGMPPGSESGIGGLTLASNEDGRLELFAKVNDGTLSHRWQAEPGGGPWREWDSFGMPGGNGFGTPEAPPVLGSNIDGRLELFVLANDGAVWHRWQKVPNGGWSSWESLQPPPAVLDQEPAVARNHDGRLELFARDTDGTVWHRWQTRPGRGPWAPWASLGTVAGLVSDIVAGTHPDGRLLLFTNHLEGDLEARQQEQTARNNGWLPEWRSHVPLAEVIPGPSGSSVTGISTPVLASENTRGRPLLCSVVSGTGALAGQRTLLFLVGHDPHSTGTLMMGTALLAKPPDEPPIFDPHPA
jgi:hypothetical protein